MTPGQGESGKEMMFVTQEEPAKHPHHSFPFSILLFLLQDEEEVNNNPLHHVSKNVKQGKLNPLTQSLQVAH